MNSRNPGRAVLKRLVIICGACLPLLGAASPTFAEIETIGTARLVGKLSHGVVRAWGETTGTIVRIGEVTIELDLSVNRRFPERASEWSGEVVEIFGKLQRKELVEQKGEFRWILQPETFDRPAKTGRKLDVQVAIIGIVTSGRVAIGGETTGRVIKVARAKLELDLLQNSEFIKVADHLNVDDYAIVIGTLKRQPRVELKRDRWIVEALQF